MEITDNRLKKKKTADVQKRTEKRCVKAKRKWKKVAKVGPRAYTTQQRGRKRMGASGRLNQELETTQENCV